MVLISKNFLIENLSVRFAIPVISVIFKNSAAVTNTLLGMLRNQFRKQHCKNTASPKHLNYRGLSCKPTLQHYLSVSNGPPKIKKLDQDMEIFCWDFQISYWFHRPSSGWLSSTGLASISLKSCTLVISIVEYDPIANSLKKK